MTPLQDALLRLTSRPEDRLARPLLQDCARQILKGEAQPAQIASLLTALRMQGETGHEIEAFVEVMLDHALAFPRPANGDPIVDTCGTGGDDHGTFNISTAAALVVAAAGVRVAKHGNRSASSKCGSADVLEACGYNIEITPKEAGRQLDEHKFCFLYARTYHASMRHAGPVRAELRFRTLFNLCGPLSNPARPTHQLVGVSSPDLVEPVANALKLMGSRGALVVHGTDGLDEISLSQTTEGLRLDARGNLHAWHWSPSDFDVKPVELAELIGGNPADNAKILRAVLEGEQGPKADAVVANAAAALWIAGAENDFRQAWGRARDAQKSGAALQLLDSMIAGQAEPQG